MGISAIENTTNTTVQAQVQNENNNGLSKKEQEKKEQVINFFNGIGYDVLLADIEKYAPTGKQAEVAAISLFDYNQNGKIEKNEADEFNKFDISLAQSGTETWGDTLTLSMKDGNEENENYTISITYSDKEDLKGSYVGASYYHQNADGGKDTKYNHCEDTYIGGFEKVSVDLTRSEITTEGNSDTEPAKIQSNFLFTYVGNAVADEVKLGQDAKMLRMDNVKKDNDSNERPQVQGYEGQQVVINGQVIE